MRWTAARSRIAAIILLAGMSGCDALTGNDEKNLSIALDDFAVLVPQGSRDSVIVTITRTNHDQPIQLSVVGTLPPGVTTSFSQNPVPPGVTTTRVRFIATSQAAPTNATVTLRAVTDGVAEKAEDIDITVALTGTYTLSTLEQSVTVAQGGAADAVVMLTRSGGNASAVTLEVSGAPAGLLATVPSPINDRGATLAISAAGGVAPGTYPITITSSAAGFTPPTQSTQLSVVVIAPPPTASVTMPFCSTFMPVWFAYKNEGASWQRVLPTGTAFTFAATSKVAVAFVFQVGTATEIDVFLSSRTGLAAQSDRDCDGSKNLSGNVLGLTAGQTGVVVMGANGTTTTTGPFNIPGVSDRPLDIVATRGTLDGGLLTPDRLIVRRSQNLTTTIPDIDFSSGESFAPVSSNLTISGFGTGFGVEYRNDLWSATSTHGTFQAASAPGGTGTLFSVPGAQLVAGDVHELVVEGFNTNGTSGHLVISYYTTTGDRIETLGPLLPSHNITVPTTQPHTRVRAQIASQAQYPSAVQFILQQVVSGTTRFLNLVGTAPYYDGTPATWDVLVPDLSNASGFNPEWALQSGQATQSQAIAYSGRDELLFGALPIAGESYRLAYVVSATPTLLLRRPGELAGRRAPLLNQYFRR